MSYPSSKSVNLLMKGISKFVKGATGKSIKFSDIEYGTKIDDSLEKIGRFLEEAGKEFEEFSFLVRELEKLEDGACYLVKIPKEQWNSGINYDYWEAAGEVAHCTFILYPSDIEIDLKKEETSK